MKIVSVIKLTILLIFCTLVGCATYQCPSEDVVINGSIFHKNEFVDVWTKIEKGELDDSRNYMNMEQWELEKKKIRFNENKDNNETDKSKLDTAKEAEKKTMDKTK